MNEERFSTDSDATSRYSPPSGGELLPPVEPPSAGFIVQLFVVPALIVIVIVGVWLTFNTLVRRSSPEKIVEGLESGPMIARWQRANELAEILKSSTHAEFKRNREAASNIANILDREINNVNSGSGMRDEDVTFRLFLATALGRFEVIEGLDILLKTAETQRDPKEMLVRDAAVKAIAERIYTLQNLNPPVALKDAGVESVLLRLAEDDERQIRVSAAYALGKLDTPTAIERLEVMVDDPDPEVRYNAAVAVAHRGNARSAETLAEMLDPEEMSGVQNIENKAQRQIMREVIVGNALKAAEVLGRRNQDADLSVLIEALNRLADADPQMLEDAQIPSRVRTDARRIAELLSKNSRQTHNAR